MSLARFCAALAMAAGVMPLHAQQNCAQLQFSAAASKLTVRGAAPADGVICYRLPTQSGDTVKLKVVRGENTIFSIPELADAQDQFTFVADKNSYQVIVGQLMRAARPEAFEILISRTGGSKTTSPQADHAPASVTDTQYSALPIEVRRYTDEVRARCKDAEPEFKPYDEMQGITVIGLERMRAIVVDAEHLCNSWIKGGNCSNRGCDLKIWRQNDGWTRIFDQHLQRKFISVDEDGHFNLMAVSLYAGDPHCRPSQKKEYTSGQTCDALVRYRDGDFVWEKLP